MINWLCENSDTKTHSDILNYGIEIFKTFFLTLVNYSFYFIIYTFSLKLNIFDRKLKKTIQRIASLMLYLD